jgi:hypothetical protein
VFNIVGGGTTLRPRDVQRFFHFELVALLVRHVVSIPDAPEHEALAFPSQLWDRLDDSVHARRDHAHERHPLLLAADHRPMDHGFVLPIAHDLHAHVHLMLRTSRMNQTDTTGMVVDRPIIITSSWSPAMTKNAPGRGLARSHCSSCSTWSPSTPAWRPWSECAGNPTGGAWRGATAHRARPGARRLRPRGRGPSARAILRPDRPDRCTAGSGFRRGSGSRSRGSGTRKCGRHGGPGSRRSPSRAAAAGPSSSSSTLPQLP